MVGRKEFTYPVGGSGDVPVSTSQAGTFETDNYDTIDALDGSAYPITHDTTMVVQELVVTQNPGGKSITITTTTGDQATIPLGTGNLALDTVQIEAISINDEDGSGGQFSALLVGE